MNKCGWVDHNSKGTFTQSYSWRPLVAETLTLCAHKWEYPHVNDKWSPLKLVASHWFSMALPHWWLSYFLWWGQWLYIKLGPDERAQLECGSNEHDHCEYKFVWTPKKSLSNNVAAAQWTVFWWIIKDSPFTFGLLIGPYVAIFRAAIFKLKRCVKTI